MKTGKYKVSFYVDLNDCEKLEDAEVAVATLIEEALDEHSFPELHFELVEEFELEYQLEHDEIEELSF